MSTKYFLGNQEVIPVTDKWLDDRTLMYYIEAHLPGREDYPFHIEYDALTIEHAPVAGDLYIGEGETPAVVIYINDNLVAIANVYEIAWDTVKKDLKPMNISLEQWAGNIIEAKDLGKLNLRTRLK